MTVMLVEVTIIRSLTMRVMIDEMRVMKTLIMRVMFVRVMVMMTFTICLIDLYSIHSFVFGIRLDIPLRRKRNKFS